MINLSCIVRKVFEIPAWPCLSATSDLEETYREDGRTEESHPLQLQRVLVSIDLELPLPDTEFRTFLDLRSVWSEPTPRTIPERKTPKLCALKEGRNALKRSFSGVEGPVERMFSEWFTFWSIQRSVRTRTDWSNWRLVLDRIALAAHCCPHHR